MRLALLLAAALLAVACAASAPPERLHTQDDARADAPPATRLVCPAGRGDCDADPANGCEADLGADADNCRACGHACPGGSAGGAMCIDGRCGQAPQGR
ncbi:MAG TPA: hypothetical protein VGL81_36425 [Polyangiaceae bacterium]|jgi:hypothetical protein